MEDEETNMSTYLLEKIKDTVYQVISIDHRYRKTKDLFSIGSYQNRDITV